MTPEQLVEQAVAEFGEDVTFEFTADDCVNVYKGDDIVAVYRATPKCPLCAAKQKQITGDERNQQILNDRLAMDGAECKVRFSVDEDILSVPVPGTIHVQREYDEFWDINGGGESYCSFEMVDPTWLQIAVCANDMISVTGDEAHFFLEGIRYIGDSEDGRRVFEFVMGS